MYLDILLSIIVPIRNQSVNIFIDRLRFNCCENERVEWELINKDSSIAQQIHLLFDFVFKMQSIFFREKWNCICMIN